MLPPWGGVKACARGLCAHGSRRIFHRDQDADFGPLPLDNSPQITDVGSMKLTGLDRKDNLLRLARPFIVEEESSIYPLVGPPLFINRASPDKSKSPPLQLVWVFCGEGLSVGRRDGCAASRER